MCIISYKQENALEKILIYYDLIKKCLLSKKQAKMQISLSIQSCSKGFNLLWFYHKMPKCFLNNKKYLTCLFSKTEKQ